MLLAQLRPPPWLVCAHPCTGAFPSRPSSLGCPSACPSPYLSSFPFRAESSKFLFWLALHSLPLPLPCSPLCWLAPCPLPHPLPPGSLPSSSLSPSFPALASFRYLYFVRYPCPLSWLSPTHPPLCPFAVPHLCPCGPLPLSAFLRYLPAPLPCAFWLPPLPPLLLSPPPAAPAPPSLRVASSFLGARPPSPFPVGDCPSAPLARCGCSPFPPFLPLSPRAWLRLGFLPLWFPFALPPLSFLCLRLRLFRSLCRCFPRARSGVLGRPCPPRPFWPLPVPFLPSAAPPPSPSFAPVPSCRGFAFLPSLAAVALAIFPTPWPAVCLPPVFPFSSRSSPHAFPSLSLVAPFHAALPALLWPLGSPFRFALPFLLLISLHPPSLPSSLLLLGLPLGFAFSVSRCRRPSFSLPIAFCPLRPSAPDLPFVRCSGSGAGWR